MSIESFHLSKLRLSYRLTKARPNYAAFYLPVHWKIFGTPLHAELCECSSQINSQPEWLFITSDVIFVIETVVTLLCLLVSRPVCHLSSEITWTGLCNL